MKASHRLESALVHALAAGARALPWRSTLTLGAALGDLARRLALRRQVADANLALAFPERSAAERAAILTAHYRELGRVFVEYLQLPELVHASAGEVVVGARGIEHLERARSAGRGVIILTAHYGNFELLSAWLGRLHPVDFLVQPFSNPGVGAQVAALRERAGVGQFSRGPGMRRVLKSLRANRWIAMAADQDARERGLFVPFFGRLASTPAGAAELSLRTGAPIVMGLDRRREDGRHDFELEAPLQAEDPRDPDAARRLTAAHTALLERRIRERPELWFWLHRRWKTRPPSAVVDRAMEDGCTDSS